jgi:outer membrane protein assembly factor BamB
MYLDFNKFISIGAIMSSPVVDRGVVYFGSMDGSLYALQ